jgi:hypothetical protein
MYSRQLEQLARQRSGELTRTSRAKPVTGGPRTPRKPLRNQTGWALVSLGLKIAESSSR